MNIVDHYTYHICEGGELLQRAEKHREHHNRLSKELFDIVHGLGCEAACIDQKTMKLRSIKFDGAPPKGWTKPDKDRLSRPKKLRANAEMLQHFTPRTYQVRWHADLAEFFSWLSFPEHYNYRGPDPGCSGSCSVGGLFAEPGLFWFCQDGPILLRLPDIEREKRICEKDGRVIDDNKLDWQKPKGLRDILKEEWDFMTAKYSHEKAARKSA